MKKHNSYYIYAFVIICILALTLLLDDSFGSRIVVVVTVSTAILGAVSILIQYKRDKNVNQATFVLEYGKYFYSLNKTEETLLLLDRYRLGDKSVIKDIDYTGIVNYLFWCEELSTLYQKNVVDLETIDNIFSYTFFLITNNKYVQEVELVPQSEFYKGTYYLHSEWTKYKRKTKQQIMHEEESLEKVADYDKLIIKGDLSNNKLF